MLDIICPFCETSQRDHWCCSDWKYGTINVRRFECKCGQDFNFYESKNKSWTIPKKIKNNEIRN